MFCRGTTAICRINRRTVVVIYVIQVVILMGGHRATYRDFPAKLHSCYPEGVLVDLGLLLFVFNQNLFDV